MSNANLTAADVMKSEVVTASPSWTLEEVSQVLSANGISGAPVVDGEGQVVGVVSQSDLLRRSYRSGFEDFPQDIFYVGLPFADSPAANELVEQASETSVQEVMSTNVIAVGPSDSVQEIASKMRELHVHRVIVLENGMLQGIISSFDLLKLI